MANEEIFFEQIRSSGRREKNNPRMQIASKEEFVHYMTLRKPPLPRKIQEALEWNRTPSREPREGWARGFRSM